MKEDRTTRGGWAHIELPDVPVLTADPEIIRLIGNLVERIRTGHARVRCERNTNLEGTASGVNRNCGVA